MMSFSDNEHQAIMELAELKSAINKLYFDAMRCEPKADQKPLELLKKSFNFLSDIINQMPGHVYWLDNNNVYIGCNELHAQHVGLSSSKDIRGKKNHDLTFTKDQSFALDDANNKVRATKKVHTVEEFGRTLEYPEGTYYLSEKRPLFDHDTGEVVGLMGISIDVTERKKIEVELNQAKTHEEELRNAVTVFAGSIVHDLRTPLSMQGMLMGLLKSTIEKALEATKQLGTASIVITKQLEKLLEFPAQSKNINQEMNLYITDTLKALEKTISGVKNTDDLVRCSLWRCLQKAINKYPCSEEERQWIHWDRSVDFNFMGNPISFYRVISNLLKNAFEQIHGRGQGEIYISACKTEIYNQLMIKDTAGGVTEEIIKGLFKNYKTTKKEGTGIGLVFCKSVMESFGGSINAYLVDGNKIEFRLDFAPKI